MSTLSPSVNIIEQDKSIYSVTSSNTVLAVVGYATFGPINQATMLSSYAQYQQTFGFPTSLGFSNLAIKNAFQNGNQIIFYRVAEQSGTYAATKAEKVITNGVSAVAGYTYSSRITDVLPGTGGFYNAAMYQASVTPGGGSAKTFYLSSPSTGRWTTTDIVTQINNQAKATSGFQEFYATNPTIVPNTYSFNVNADTAGAQLYTIDINSVDTLTSIASSINYALKNGTRGYTAAIFDSTTNTNITNGGNGINTIIYNANHTSGLTSTAVNFGIRINDSVTYSINLTGISSTTTYAQLITMINAYFISNNINAVCSWNNVSGSYGLIFVSKTNGASSKCWVHPGTTTGSNYALFVTSGGSGTTSIILTDATFGGQTGYTGALSTTVSAGAASNAGNAAASASVNGYTSKIRITSGTTGSSSSVAITAGTITYDLTSSASLLGGTASAIAGAIACSVTASISSSGAIVIANSVTSNTVAPSITSLGSTSYLNDFMLLFGTQTQVTGTAAVSSTIADMLQIVADQYGSSGNLIQVVKTTTTNPSVVGVVSASVANGGSGYAVGDLVYVSGGNGDAVAFVTSVNSTAVTAVSIVNQGSGYSTSLAVSTTAFSTSGLGLTLNITAGATSTVNLQVLYNGSVQETFNDVSLSISSSNYFATVINQSPSLGGSAWIYMNPVPYIPTNDGMITWKDGIYTLGMADSSTEVSYSGNTTIGSYNYRSGTDGIPSSGDPALFVAALSSSSDLANADVFNYHILITPDDTEQPTQDAAIALANTRMDFVYIVDPPLGLTSSQVIDWHNGNGNGRTSPVSSSYAAVYWPWLKTYDSYWGRYSWCPPSVFVASLFMQTDNNFAPWFAPAGNTRGQIVASDVETTVSQAQRDSLYGNLNCVNPIVKFASAGLVVYGQKTTLRSTTALNRVNVRRMVVYLKKLVKNALNNMIFEPNNPDSWSRAKDLVTAVLEPIRQGGGISQYVVVIDSTTNTPNVVAQNMMNGIIKIVPTSTVEIINLDLNIYQSGTTITG